MSEQGDRADRGYRSAARWLGLTGEWLGLTGDTGSSRERIIVIGSILLLGAIGRALFGPWGIAGGIVLGNVVVAAYQWRRE